jgi:hypothetical protein
VTLRRLSLIALACALALAFGSSARAGTQLAPGEGDTTDGAPVFVASLTSSDNHPKVLVARAEDADAGRYDSVGTCDLQPVGNGQYGCRLAAPLAPGDYAWTLQTDYLFCDGDAGQYCNYWAPRLAGPTGFTVAAPPAPAPAPVDPGTIVPGSSIGGVRLGMTEQQVLDAYGAPGQRRVASRAKGARTGADYQLHGGLLQVSYLDGRVVSISTTSPYYKGAGGLAVGGLVGRTGAWRGFRQCGGVLVQPAPSGAETQLVLTAARRVAAIRVDAAPSSCQ